MSYCQCEKPDPVTDETVLADGAIADNGTYCCHCEKEIVSEADREYDFWRVELDKLIDSPRRDSARDMNAARPPQRIDGGAA